MELELEPNHRFCRGETEKKCDSRFDSNISDFITTCWKTSEIFLFLLWHHLMSLKLYNSEQNGKLRLRYSIDFSVVIKDIFYHYVSHDNSSSSIFFAKFCPLISTVVQIEKKFRLSIHSISVRIVKYFWPKFSFNFNTKVIQVVSWILLGLFFSLFLQIWGKKSLGHTHRELLKSDPWPQGQNLSIY